LAALSRRQRAVIGGRFPKRGRRKTLQALADRWQLSRERIRQIGREAEHILACRIERLRYDRRERAARESGEKSMGDKASPR